MRREDRQPAKRVFPLLQNLDLDSVTFSQLQSVGNPISIEDMNEQEMLDLIVVNLARLCVSGEWTGLLEAGGGAPAAIAGTPNGDWFDDYSNVQNIGYATPWRNTISSANTAWSSPERQYFWPFIAANTGDLTEMSISVNAAAAGTTMTVAIYEVADNGNPTTVMGTAAFDVSSTGYITQTSLSDTITLTRGNLYWYSIVRTVGSNTPTLVTVPTQDSSGFGSLANPGTGATTAMINYTTTGSVSDPAVLDEMRGNDSYNAVVVTISWL